MRDEEKFEQWSLLIYLSNFNFLSTLIRYLIKLELK